jgi:hypothetical protein
MVHLSGLKPSWWLKALSRISPVLAESYSRYRLDLPQTLPTDFRFKIAESKEDFEQAFLLLKQSKSPATKFHLLPQTQVFLLMQGPLPIATATLVRDNELGLPAESHLDLAWLKLKENKLTRNLVGELTSFAVHPDFQKDEKSLFFFLIRFVLHCCEENQIRFLVLMANSWTYFFCKSILLLSTLGTDPLRRTAGILDLNSASQSYLKKFKNRSSCRNLYQFMQDGSFIKNSIPPKRKSPIQFLSPEWLDYFFNQQNPVLSCLSDFEKFLLSEIYRESEYLDVLPKPNLLTMKVKRELRHPIRLKAQIKTSSGQKIRVEIQNVGHNGLGGMMSRLIVVGKNELEIEMGDGSICHLRGVVMWQSVQAHFGFKIVSPPPAWLNLVEHLEAQPVLKSA